MSRNLNPAIDTMSRSDLEKTAYDIMVDGGMDPKLAEQTVSTSTRNDLEDYIDSDDQSDMEP